MDTPDARLGKQDQQQQAARDLLVMSLRILPHDVITPPGTRVFFTAIAQNQADEPVGGVLVTWRVHDVDGEEVPISRDGQFKADRPGSFVVTADTEIHRGQTTVTVAELTASAPRAPGMEGADAAEREPRWDEKNLRTAFAPENRRGTNLAHSRLSTMVRALGNLSEAANAGSANFRLTVPVLDLPGRGLDLTLDLVYNSSVWHKGAENDDGTFHLTYDIDAGWPAPGWSLGFGKLVRTAELGNESMLVDADGTRHPYRTVSKTVHFGEHGGDLWAFKGQTTDGTLIDYYSEQLPQESVAITSAEVSYPNGTAVHYAACGHAPPAGAAGLSGAAEIYPTQIADANGNYITITYQNNTGPEIETITDTLGRVVTCHYDSANLLTAITGPGLDGSTRTLIRIHYVYFPIGQLLSGSSFAADVIPILRSGFQWLIDAIYYPGTATGYWFSDGDSWSDYGLLAKVSEHRGMGFSAASLAEQGTPTAGTITRQRAYDYPLRADGLLDAAPAYTTMTETWEAMDTPPAVTRYAVRQGATPRSIELTYPDGRRTVQLSYNKTGKFDDGLVYQHETRDAFDEGRLLHKTSVTWEQGDYESPRAIRAELTDELGQTTATEYDYGPVHNQVAEVREYDFGGVDVLRKVHTDYVADQSFADAHIFNLAKVVQVYGGHEIDPVSRTEYDYDWSTLGLLDAPGVVQHFTNPFTNRLDGYPPRPNVTKITTYGDAAKRTQGVTETRRYDITGNLVSDRAACCEQTSYEYTEATQFAYPTAVTRGAADPDVTPRMRTSATYDFHSGVMLSATDANGRRTQIIYDPATLRRAKVLSPTLASTTYEYDDPALTITVTRRDSAGAIAARRMTRLNGAGLVRYEAVLTEAKQEIIQQPDGSSVLEEVPLWWDTVTTQYDTMGRVRRQSRPLRRPAQGPSLDIELWTETSYDALGRVTQVRQPDGSQAYLYYSEPLHPTGVSSLPARTTRLVDAWGRERWIGTDALGRLTQVAEPDPNGSGPVLEPGNVGTFYSYDALDQLVGVVQPPRSQNRVFRYDSLGRLTHQYLPEKGSKLTDAGEYGGTHGGGLSWSDVYFYDDRSNLVARIDSRGVKTNYYYDDDPLNRLQRVTYDTTGFGDTANPILPAPSVGFEYMTTGDVTRLSKVTTAAVSTEEYGYDTEGRLSSKTQTMRTGKRPAAPHMIDYGYDSLDRLSEMRYPAESGFAEEQRRLIQYNYDVAGRLNGLTANGAHYVSQIVYNASRQIASLTVGENGPLQLTEDYEYHAETGLLQRQRVQRAGVPLLDLSYDYLLARGAENGSGRTGQLTRLINNLDDRRSQDYDYDAWGRLIRVTSGNKWSQDYGYDRYGNRSSVTVNNAGDMPVLPDGLETVIYDTRTNRITTAGFAYDEAGNQTRTPHADGSRRHQYDAAGRLVQILDDAGRTVEAYTYGSDNRRLTTQDGATGKPTYYVWSGNTVIAEYSDPGPEVRHRGSDSQWAKSYVYFGVRLLATLTPGAPVEYHHPDRLGTRLLTNEENATVLEQVTLPFGVALDSESSGAVDQTSNQRFTSYDRSPLIGLDYAVNRYYDSQQGRFTQVDPLGIGVATLAHPQSLNLYSYVENDPINSRDPAGLQDPYIYPETLTYILVVPLDRDQWAPRFEDAAEGPLTQVGRDWTYQQGFGEPRDPGRRGGKQGGSGRRGPVDIDNRAYDRLVKPYLDMKGPRPTSQVEKLMIAYWGAWALVGGIAVAGLSSIGLLAAAMARAAAVNAIRASAALGLAGEEILGGLPKARVISITGTAAYRVLDALNGYGVTEVKNVAYQSLTAQLEDSILYAQALEVPFNLVTRLSTELSGPLAELVDSGVVNWIPVL